MWADVYVGVCVCIAPTQHLPLYMLHRQCISVMLHMCMVCICRFDTDDGIPDDPIEVLPIEVLPIENARGTSTVLVPCTDDLTSCSYTMDGKEVSLYLPMYHVPSCHPKLCCVVLTLLVLCRWMYFSCWPPKSHSAYRAIFNIYVPYSWKSY